MKNGNLVEQAFEELIEAIKMVILTCKMMRKEDPTRFIGSAEERLMKDMEALLKQYETRD